MIKSNILTKENAQGIIKKMNKIIELHNRMLKNLDEWRLLKTNKQKIEYSERNSDSLGFNFEGRDIQLWCKTAFKNKNKKVEYIGVFYINGKKVSSKTIASFIPKIQALYKK